MSADVEPLTDERLAELWQQVQQDRRDGYPTLLAEQLIREVRRLRDQSNSWQRIVGDYARRVERITSLDVLFDALVEAQYGGMTIGADEREAVAQLAEAVQPLLRAAFGGAS